MQTEPVLRLLLSTRLTWLELWLLYAAIFVAFSLVMCYFVGGETKVRTFLRDPLSIPWSLLVLGPAPAIYILIHEQSSKLADEFGRLGGSGQKWDLSPPGWFVASLVIVLAIAVIDHYSRARYRRTDPARWFNSPASLALPLRAFFNIPMGYMLGQSGLRLLLQMMAIFRFVSSPQTDFTQRYFHPDGLFGLEGIGSVFFSNVTLLAYASFIPMTMLLSESKRRYAWQYIALWLAGWLSGAILIMFVKGAFDNLVESIRDGALAYFTLPFEKDPAAAGTLEEVAEILKLSAIRSLPAELEWPVGIGYLSALSAVFNFLGGLLLGELGLRRIPAIRDFLQTILPPPPEETK